MEGLYVDQEAFLAWIEAHAPGEVLGRVQHAYCCPVRNYLLSTDPDRFAGCWVCWQGQDAWLMCGTIVKREWLLSFWCGAFMRAIDVMLPRLAPTPFLRTYVTRETALWMLTGDMPRDLVREDQDATA